MPKGDQLAEIKEEIRFKLKRSKADNIDIGFLLRKAKNIIKRKRLNQTFHEWCAADDQFGWKNREIPNKFLRLADLSDTYGRKIILLADIHTTALFKLARPNCPAKAVKEVLKKAQKEHLSGPQVQQIIDAEKFLDDFAKLKKRRAQQGNGGK